MNRETSLYLDFVRFTAAMVVMIGHLSGKRFTDGMFWQVGRFMDDAVIVFFVLSGFVIAHVVSRSEVDVTKYAIARAARIYSVALPALLLTFFLDAAGTHIAPSLYDESWGYKGDNPLGQFFLGLVFLNQLWHLHSPVGSMLPYWSLGFEVWYYIFFGIMFFSRNRWKIPAVLVAFAIAGPRIVTLFPIWLMGYFTYKYVANRNLETHIGLSCLSISIFGYVTYFLILKPWYSSNDFVFDIIGVNHVFARYTAGLLFSMHLVGACWVSKFLRGSLPKGELPIRWLAGATFTIYLFHMPVAQFLTTVVPWDPSTWQTRALMFLGTLVLMFLIAAVTERKKTVWRDWIASGYERISALLLRRQMTASPQQKRQ